MKGVKDQPPHPPPHPPQPNSQQAPACVPKPYMNKTNPIVYMSKYRHKHSLLPFQSRRSDFLHQKIVFSQPLNQSRGVNKYKSVFRSAQKDALAFRKSSFAGAPVFTQPFANTWVPSRTAVLLLVSSPLARRAMLMSLCLDCIQAGQLAGRQDSPARQRIATRLRH